MNTPKVVLNLTTTHSRLELCSATLWSLVNQSFLPNEINIWISRNAYLSDQGINELPVDIIMIIKHYPFININYVDNTGPYRKIIPALRAAAESDVLVYADDDVIYSKFWLGYLISSFLHHNGEFVISSRVRKMTKNLFGKFQSYNRFPILVEEIVIHNDFIITGVGGCVLQKKHINPEYIYTDDFIKIAPKTDDLWMSKIISLSGSKVCTCPDALNCVMEINHEINALNHLNTVKFKGGFLTKIFETFKMRVCGYLGFRLSNNDRMIKSIYEYFSKK